MTQDKDQMRAEFEAWACPQADKNAIAKFEDGLYMSAKTSMAWAAWQAARASAQPQIDSHLQRWAALQQHQQMMREPERTIVCDVLANGQLLCGADGSIDAARYASAPQGVPDGFVLVRTQTAKQLEDAWNNAPKPASEDMGGDFFGNSEAAPQPVAPTVKLKKPSPFGPPPFEGRGRKNNK